MPPRRGVVRRGRSAGVPAPQPALGPNVEPQEFEVPLGDNVTVGSAHAESVEAADQVPVESGEVGESGTPAAPAVPPVPGAPGQGSVLERAEETIERLLQAVGTLAAAVDQGAATATAGRAAGQTGV